MRKLLFLVFILCSATSCQWTKTEKISSETFYEEEVKAINWSSVDQYPLFPDCEGLSEKNEQLECFTRILSERLKEAISGRLKSVPDPVRDTIYLSFSISETAELNIGEINSGSEIRRLAPKLDSVLKASVSGVNLVAPAYKRGIPVRSEFRMPLVIISERL